MIVKIRVIFIVLASTSFLALSEAVNQNKIDQSDLLTATILSSFKRSKIELWPKAIVDDPYYQEHFQKDQKRLELFSNSKYKIFQRKICIFVECRLFFQHNRFEQLEKPDVDMFSQDWVLHKRVKKQNEKYSDLFYKFLSDKGVINSIEMEIDDQNLEMMFETILDSSIELASLRQSETADDKKFYDDIFKAIETDNFKTCLSRFTRWWVWNNYLFDMLIERINGIYFNFNNLGSRKRRYQ